MKRIVVAFFAAALALSPTLFAQDPDRDKQTELQLKQANEAAKGMGLKRPT